MKTTDHLIINGPYEKPKLHLNYNREIRKFELLDGRRRAGFIVASEHSESFDDPGIFVELDLANRIRERVEKWKENGYLGITSITKDLLEHWKNPDREQKFFFCQIEAIETLIWLLEAPESEKRGIEIPLDGGDIQRICSKMATGTGKTIVMAMLIALHIINKATYPKDLKFSKNVLIVAPGLTVKSRLQVLIPDSPGNYFEEFDIIPPDLFDKLRQGKVKIINWHMLDWDTQDRINKKIEKGTLRTVDKRKKIEISDEAYIKQVLEELGDCKNLLVINDEAHHAWRLNPEAKGKYQRIGEEKDSAEEATIWINGLDRIDKSRGILRCHDFSATPFYPSGKKVGEDQLFTWIVSDFGLNDAIESGLVKTPRVVIRDDGKLDKKMKSKFYHIYNDPTVKNDLNRSVEAEVPLPDLVVLAYYHLGKDWLETLKLWRSSKPPAEVPPVMITVCNRTETAARVENAFLKGKIKIDELKDTEKTLRIDSKILSEAENKETEEKIEKSNGLSKLEQAELLRQKVDTVGKKGKPGEQIQNIISVGMLSEGWDAKTVTHIMGLRAFSSQLLCEQVVGRGLRRVSYDVDEETGLFKPEYVNIFGVPFTFLPHEGGEDTPPEPPKPRTRIFVDDTKKEHEIKWPNIIRINHVYSSKLELDMKEVKRIELRPEDTPLRSELAPFLEGKPDSTKLSEINLSDEKVEDMLKVLRKQRLIFEIARDIFDQVKPTWHGKREFLLIQITKIVEDFIESNKLVIKGKTYNEDLKKRLLILLNMNKIVQHLFNAIRFKNTQELVLIFDKENPIKSTSKMMTWYTSKPCELNKRSHISHTIFDSSWEATESFELDRNENVESWAKNDHLNFFVNYVFGGVIHKYYPDFLIKLKNGKMFVLEVKGRDDQKNKTKREYFKEWIDAVNTDGRFGKWEFDVSFRTADVKDILKKHSI